MSGADALRHLQSPKLDYAAIGFRCGLEIHQQLDTGKLFSRMPSRVIEGDDDIKAATTGSVTRMLRPTGGELGQLDAAAAAEARRGRRFKYLSLRGLTSLVELDEEPPKPLDNDALEVALTFAGLLGSRPVDELHVMRKTVIDGSNTGGFQRTVLVATGGRLAVDGGDVGVWTVALEEDSARPYHEENGVATYTLDRLGIPLIEIATAPDITDPAHAQRTAARIGALLRATGRVKRGLGTIRQDLNVSVAVGDRVEIKGCQDLRAVARVIEAECRRQLWMHHVATELRARGFSGTVGEPVHVTEAFAKTEAKLVKDATAKGLQVWGLRLPHFAGLLKGLSKDAPRLGRELADHAKVAAGVKGVFHSDELPGYGITQAEVDAVRAKLACAAGDAFALCVERSDVAMKALGAVADRARAAAGGPLREVRGAQPDDSTRFLRPMPGAARMYPETDVPPTRVHESRWRRVLSSLPPTPEEKVAQLTTTHGLGAELARQLVADGWDADFSGLVAAGAEPNVAARTLLHDVPLAKDPQRVLGPLPGVFAALKAGRFAKEAVPAVLKALDEGAPTIEAAIAMAGVTAADTTVVDATIRRVLAERADYVKARGMAALGPLMGPVMADLRGKADGQVISQRLKELLAEAAKQ